MQEIVDEIARLLDASVTIEDRSFHLLAYGAQSGDIDAVRQESILRRRASDEVRAHFEAYGIATSTVPVRIPGIPGLRGMLDRVCVPLRHGGVTYGYLWLLDSGALTDVRLAAVAPLVERAAAVLAREARTGRARLWDFFSTDPAARAAAALQVTGPVAAIAVRTAPDRAGALWRLPRGVLAEPGDGPEPLTAVLAPASQAPAVARTLQTAYGTAAGVGGAREDSGDAWESWAEAVLALRVAEHVREAGPVADWAGLGVYRFLARLPRSEIAELAAESASLGDLAGTVETYLDRAGQVQETAAALGVHRQTLYYRLGRAGQLTGLDLADGRDRLLLHLSLKAAALIGEPGRHAPSRRTS
ncbi:PucR family transcriptional regulator [Microtetraspora niveoalba]|uniref:PucR family transcriptional regulator n=1 Tax=Microtetraspora niveoalba TaxID=46175 RepID=UPI001FE04085|nr:PucR family transcriptional regulator [Microtetraspora niveoalba]